MEKFTMEECNLMCIYDTGTKNGLLAELTAMQAHLQPDADRFGAGKAGGHDR